MEYIDKLKDPRWHSKAKRIIKRDGFKCTSCGNKNHLEVHHTFYYDNYPDPWTYPNDSLLTVCKKCHRKFHEYNEVPIEKHDEHQPIKKKIQIPVYKIHKFKKQHKLIRIKKERLLCLAEIQSIRGIRIKQRLVK